MEPCTFERGGAGEISGALLLVLEAPRTCVHISIDSIWGFSKIGDPGIDPQIVGSLDNKDPNTVAGSRNFGNPQMRCLDLPFSSQATCQLAGQWLVGFRPNAVPCRSYSTELWLGRTQAAEVSSSAPRILSPPPKDLQPDLPTTRDPQKPGIPKNLAKGTKKTCDHWDMYACMIVFCIRKTTAFLAAGGHTHTYTPLLRLRLYFAFLHLDVECE